MPNDGVEPGDQFLLCGCLAVPDDFAYPAKESFPAVFGRLEKKLSGWISSKMKPEKIESVLQIENRGFVRG